MGLRAYWREHPWLCGWISLIAGCIALVGSLAVVVHERGRAHLRATLAAQRAAGMGASAEDFIARYPSVDPERQRRAWDLFGAKAAAWAGWNDEIQSRWSRVLAAGAGWTPGDEERALVEAARPRAETLRSFIRDERPVLSILGWASVDIANAAPLESYRFASISQLRHLASWLVLAGACGDVGARDDLARLREAGATGGAMLDVLIAARAQQGLDELTLSLALRGKLPPEEALRADPGAIGGRGSVTSALSAERLLYLARTAQASLAGTGAPPEDWSMTSGGHRDPTGFIDWVRGPGDLALSLEIEADQERGRPRPALPERWFDLRTRFDPRNGLPNLAEAAGSIVRDLNRHLVVRAAAALAALAADGRLPPDQPSARAALGSWWHDELEPSYRVEGAGFTYSLGLGDILDPRYSAAVGAKQRRGDDRRVRITAKGIEISLAGRP